MARTEANSGVRPGSLAATAGAADGARGVVVRPGLERVLPEQFEQQVGAAVRVAVQW